MIASLSGIIRLKSPGHIVIETGGVGYGVSLPLSTYYALPDIGDNVFLLIYTHVREDALTLYGFITTEEKALFEKLIGITGIGPRLAVNILSGTSVPELTDSILSENITKMLSIPGVGKKMAERILLELKDKIKGEVMEGKTDRPVKDSLSHFTKDAVAALVSLGYKQGMAEGAVRNALPSLKEPFTLEVLIKESLQNI